MQGDSSKVKGPSIRLSTVATTTRQTPKTDFGTVMRDGLIKAGNVAMDGIQRVSPLIPGSAIVSAAVAGANIAGTVGAATYGNGVASSAAGLTAGGGGGPGAIGGGAAVNAPGTFGANGALAIPGRHPGLDTPVGGNAGAANGAVGQGGSVSGASDAFNQMMGATQRMAEFQASFNLQYLQLQEKIQQDTRQFNLVSNIMKTKHDAAKNALNNVR